MKSKSMKGEFRIMKINSRRVLSFFLCTIMVFASSMPAVASTNNIRDPNIRESLENEKPTEEIMSESVELEYGTMYLEEKSEYRIAYIIYNDGYITYSVCYKDNPSIAHMGSYYPDYFLNTSNNDVLHDFVETNNVVSTLLSLEPEESIDFSARPHAKSNTIITTSDALEYARNYAPEWKTPINSNQIGAYRPGNITVNVYESVNGRATRDTILNYYKNDTLASIASIAFGFNITKLMNVVSNVFDGTRDYIAERNGTLTYFTIDNSRTKTARINGDTYYWAGWDREYGVYSGDKKTAVEVAYNFAHSDYNQSG